MGYPFWILINILKWPNEMQMFRVKLILRNTACLIIVHTAIYSQFEVGYFKPFPESNLKQISL